MNLAYAQIAQFLALVEQEHFVDALIVVGERLVTLTEMLSKGNPRDILIGEGVLLPECIPLDGYTIPDAIWNALFYLRPRIGRHPLGEITERAVKKLVADLILLPGMVTQAETNPPLDVRETQRRLQLAIKTQGPDGILRNYVSHFFFEMGMDFLRREKRRPYVDYSRRYHFSNLGDFIPLNAEARFRRRFEDQCREAAARFLPHLFRCLEPGEHHRLESELWEGLIEVFGRPGPRRHRIAADDSFVNVVVGGRSLKRLSEKYDISDHVLKLSLHTKTTNVSFSFGPLEKFLHLIRQRDLARHISDKKAIKGASEATQRLVPKPLHSLVRDLLDIAVVIYMADRYVKRGPQLDRRIGTFLPVRHPEVWEQARPDLERMISFLGRDLFKIHFAQRRCEKDPIEEIRVMPKDNRCVCLFSGGLDSVAGAIWALRETKDPIFIGHYANNRLSSVQKSLFADIKLRYGNRPHYLGLYVNKRKGKLTRNALGDSPSSVAVQHLRSFLFMALATAVALELQIQKVFMFENGPVAINPLLSEARVNTRTSHPFFLEAYQALVRKVFGAHIDVMNPFLGQTKGEVVSILADSDMRKLVSETVSCYIPFRVPLLAWRRWGPKQFSGLHDGTCLACVLRRVAVYAADMWAEDTRYLYNVFRAYPDLPEGSVEALTDLIRFCFNVVSMNDAELMRRVPDFSICAGAVHPKALMAMYRRHAKEVLSCFAEKGKDMRLWEDFGPILAGFQTPEELS
jgi:7-cyano-7-deazaguanine synthase in queuosine biosynthesis